MASRVIEMGLALVSVAMLCIGAAAQSGCTDAITGLAAPCLNYITGNSSTPSSPCCSLLDNVVQSSPQCLCSMLNGGGGGASLGIAINRTLALSLPSACKVQTPPVSQCHAADGPSISAPSPAYSPASPADSANDTPEAAITPSASDIPSGTGSKTVPSTGSSSDGSIINSPIIHFVVFFLFVASWASL